VQIFAVTRDWPGVTAETLLASVARAGSRFPRLDDGTLTGLAGPPGPLCAAALAHGAEAAAPRRYRAARDGATVLFDGLPADRLGRFPGHDAAELLERWDELPGRLEGVFCAVRIDPAAGEVDCLLDALGMAQVYILQRGGRWVLSNCLEAIRDVAGPAAPDPLGVSSLLTLGWAAGDRTLSQGVEVLPGGHLHRLGDRRASTPLLTPATVAPRSLGPARPVTDLAARLTRTTAAAVDGIAPLTLGLTAGRDSRVVLALALAAGADVECFTSGSPGDVDVRTAAQLADRAGLRHRITAPPVPSASGWAAEATRFVAQTGGLASFWDVTDWAEHQSPPGRLGLQLWGPGGEIGRAGNVGVGIPLMANLPGPRWSWRAQRWVLAYKSSDWGGLVTPAAAAESRRYLEAYLARRREEGWRPREVLESYYAFERVKHWAAAGVRRAAEDTDIYAPFVSRDFIEHCYRLAPGRRYMEAAHHGLLAVLAPQLADIPFEHPFKPQRPRLASVHVLGQALGWAARRARASSTSPAAGAAPPSFRQAWYEAGLATHRDAVLSVAGSPLWEFVDRRAYERLVCGPPAARARVAEGLSRALTVFWHLHGGR